MAKQLQYALDYRVVIERAVGYLMAKESIDAVAAFNALRDVGAQPAYEDRRRRGARARERSPTRLRCRPSACPWARRMAARIAGTRGRCDENTA